MNIFTNDIIKVFRLLVIAAGIIMGGMESQAQAGDKKVFSATLCTPVVANAGPNAKATSFTYVSYKYASGVIYNYGTHTLSIQCEVTRDNTTNKNGLKAWGFVGRDSKNDSDLLRCRMKSINLYHRRSWGERPRGLYAGTTANWVNLRSNVSKQTFKNRVKQPEKSSGIGYSSYLLECEIPKYESGKNPSYLASYWVEEY